MTDHALSQEEIDALLRGDVGASESEAMDLEPLVNLFRVVLEHVASVVSPVAGQQFAAGHVVADFMPWEDLQNQLITPLMAKVEYEGALQGVQLSVADGSTQQQLRALSEEDPVTVLNKMALAFAAGLEEQLGLDLETDISSFESPTETDGVTVPWRAADMCAVFQLSLQGQAGDVTWREVLPADVAADMLAKLHADVDADGDDGEAAEAPVGSVAADAPEDVLGLADATTMGSSVAAPVSGGQPVGNPTGVPVAVAPAQFAPLGSGAPTEQPGNIGLIMDVPLQVTVELGRRRMLVRDVLELGKGSLIELEKLAGEPVDVFVNGKLIAKGEVVVIDENFGIKVTSIVTPVERLQNLQ